MSLKFYNTLTRQKEEFLPIDSNEVRMYSCGPTVYDYAHIGNLRAYVFTDILCRTLRYDGFKVKQIMNITDVGHLTSDADSGEDKMTKGLLREGKTLTLENMRRLAEFYTEKFKEDTKKLNIEDPSGMYFASDYLKEDVVLINKLEEKGYTYKTSDGIYFDTSMFPDYGILRGGIISKEETKSRLVENSEKKNPEDFVLWKFSSKGGQGSKIGFESPLGQGFPGWHIECSAMSMHFLGEQFDIHTGGIDHVPIHHTNEIAQSESATGKKPSVRFWMHNEHVDMGGEKMAKSSGGFIKLNTLIEKGINPIAYRFWLIMANYHTKMSFNWEALEGAETALKRLYGLYLSLGKGIGQVSKEYQQKFKEYIEDDLDTPRALSLLWDLIKDEKISTLDKKATILDFDKVLGLGFENIKEEKISDEVIKLAEEREQARKGKDFKKSDELRAKINSLGYDIKDGGNNYKINKIR
ncbi:MAG: cysteine--tRNA ligase [Candidatus Paceibacterota bacterium]